MVKFRASEKPLWVTVHDVDTASYLLASSASRVNLSPLGGAMLPGPMFQLTYFGPALKKLGVEVEVFRAGKYKSAMEPLVNDGPSDAAREMYEAMEESLRATFVEAIATGRNREAAEVRSLA